MQSDVNTEKVIIELYNKGYGDLELSKIVGLSERTVQRILAKLRLSKKITNRLDIARKISKEVYNTEELSDSNYEELVKNAKINWQIPKSNITTEKKEFKTYLVIADTHVPSQNTSAIKSVLLLCNDVKFDGFIIAGDFMDLNCISHWTKNKRKTLEMKRLKGDYIEGNILLDEFDKRLPKNCDKRFLYGNHCLDEKTELLTKRGYVNYQNINQNDEILSLNPKTQRLEWTDIQKILIYPFEGNLNRIKTKGIDLLATSDHNFFYRSPIFHRYHFKPIKEINNATYEVPVSGTMNKKEFPINDDILKLCAWLLTDGTIKRIGKYDCMSYGVYQRPEKMPIIENIVKKLGWDYSIKFRQKNVKEICGKKLKKQPQPSGYLYIKKEGNHILKQYIVSKKLPNWVSQLSKRQFDLFLSSLIDGDGSRVKKAKCTMLYGMKPFLEDVQINCILNGYSASISAYRPNNYRLNIVPRLFHSYSSQNESNKIHKEYYKGNVWDLTVKYHNFLIRRNGVCHFTGNCRFVEDLVEERPELEGLFEPKECLKLEERGYKVFTEQNHAEKLGKLYVTHGVWAGTSPVRAALAAYKTNVLFGHVHTEEERLESSAPKELAIVGASMGALSDLNPAYMQNKTHRWSHGFAIVHVFPNGFFHLELIRIVNGRYIYNMRVYDGSGK